MVALYPNTTDYTTVYHLTLLPEKYSFINHGFKYDSVKVEIKSQITPKDVQFRSQINPLALCLRSEFLF